MPWHLQPLIWPIIIATLALLAVPRPARPDEPSPAVRAACEGDIKRLCPKEHAAADGAAIAVCMRAHAFAISRGCVRAYLNEHPQEKNR
jgi:hypothetical protein